LDEVGLNLNNSATNNGRINRISTITTSATNNAENSSLASESIGGNSPYNNLNNNKEKYLNNLNLIPNYYKEQLFAVDALFCSKTELLKCLLFCLSQK